MVLSLIYNTVDEHLDIKTNNENGAKVGSCF